MILHRSSSRRPGLDPPWLLTSGANRCYAAIGVINPIPGIGEVFKAARTAQKIEHAAEESATIVLKGKEDGSTAQHAAAARKAERLDKLAQEGKLSVVKKPQRGSTSASSRYKRAGGKVEESEDVDHTQDLQLGGVDDVATNAAPLNKSVNRSLGSQIHHQIKMLPQGAKVGRVIYNAK